MYYDCTYIFAGPWPRACQIICFLCLLQHCLCYVCKATFTFFRFCCNILCVRLSFFTISAIVVVHCLDNCRLLFKKCVREGGCQGAPGLWHSYLFHLLGAPFSHTILYTTICAKNQIFVKTCAQNGVKIH